MTIFNAQDLIDWYEDGDVDEEGRFIAVNDQRVKGANKKKFAPTGSMADQQKLLERSNYYANEKREKTRKRVKVRDKTKDSSDSES